MNIMRSIKDVPVFMGLDGDFICLSEFSGIFLLFQVNDFKCFCCVTTCFKMIVLYALICCVQGFIS